MLDNGAAKYKTYLESVTTRELIKLAEGAGIDIPSDLDRIFIIRELLDNKYDEKLPAEPLNEKIDLKTAALPGQYHITYLEVLPRDPQWVFVFWEVKAQDRERYETDPHFEGYALKGLENGITEFFTVPVGREDNSWYLGFPGGGTFRIALWARGLNIPLILSRPFELPRFINKPENEAYLTRPLIQLSGAEAFTVLRRADRIPHNRP